MRITSAIDRPLRDEHVIGVDPPLQPELPGVWRRRINPFLGRALSDRALSAEQEVRSGIQRLRGQSVTAGVINGLDLLLEAGARAAPAGEAVVQILPGAGLARSGEDAVIGSARRIAIGNIPAHARVDQLDAIASGAPPTGGEAPAGASEPDATASGGALNGLRPLLPRRIGPALSSVITAPAADDLPRVAVLVAEPVSATILGRPGDDCPRDPRDDPYDDLQRIDGCRLLLSFWPAEMIAIAGGPDYALPPAGAMRRNAIAYRIFAIEHGMLPGEMHPWEQVGVPLALIGFNPDWTLDFVDRAAVVRLGGRPNPRTPLVPQSGTPLLSQARVSQFVEHLSDLPDLAASTLGGAFRQLPPIGFLPATLVDIPTRRQSFFPPGFSLDAAPVPLEQLDTVVHDSAGLAPISLDIPDEVELLVPVPDRVYEPGLLETAAIDPQFAQAIARYVGDRSDWLVRREMVRRRRDLLIDAATGQRPSWPTSDLPAAEVLPYPATRAPLTATRVRRVAAGAALRTLRLLNAGSSLPIVANDRVYLWVRVVEAAGLTGISLRFGIDTLPNDTGNFVNGVFWGAPTNLPVATGDAAIAQRRQSDLPPAGQWTRLEVAAAAPWTAAGGTLVGAVADGVELAQVGGTVEWGPIGKIDAADNETVWITSDAPPGSTLRDSAAAGGVTGWPQAAAGDLDVPIESDFATVEANGVRSAADLDAFHGRWSQPFLTADFGELAESGIDGFVAALEARVKATNDAIDAGFLKARADIYRVRQFMLGGDAASRLVTSPSLADLAVRDEGARATSEGLAAFLKAAYQTDPSRDPDAPLETGPVRAAADRPAVPDAGPRVTSVSFVSNFTFNAIRATTQPRIAPTPAAQPFLTMASQPVMMINLAQPTFVAPTAMALQPTTTFAAPSLAGLRASTLLGRGFTSTDITGQLALPGAVERTASVAERLRQPPSVEAHQQALAGKLEVISVIAGLMGDPNAGVRPKGVALGDLPAPGFRLKDGANVPTTRVANTIGDVIFDGRQPAQAQLYIDLDQISTNDARHEADYFRAAVSAIDNTIALMRLVEGRIALYEQLIADARAIRGALMDRVADADARLRTIGVELEEARHDVGLAAALLAEEQVRVAALNAKRAAILAQHAKMVVFRRPRRALHVTVMPTSPATSALTEPPVAVCLRDHAGVPEEIRDYVGLFRDAPITWFPAVKAQLDLLDRLDATRAALLAARARAAAPLQLFAMPQAAAAPKLLAAVHSVTVAQRAVIDRRRLVAAQLDVSAITAVDLSLVRRAVAEVASMGDLIAGDHNRPTLARLASSEIEAVAQVAGCLHASFAEVPPIMRLKWAELLSEFDRPAPLSSLSGLPEWNSLPLEDRRAQQGFVDWLFGRIDRSIGDAEAAMNDLVRVCLLMAAHAPVDRVIPARLVAPAPARAGATIDLAVDVRLARVGMTVLIRGADTQPVAHAVVEDLADGVAHARIARTFQNVATIVTSVRVELSDRALG